MMTIEDYQNVIAKLQLKTNELIVLRYRVSHNKTATCMGRIQNTSPQETEKGYRLKIGYLTFGWPLESVIDIRRANFYDKLFRKFWGNSLDLTPLNKH